MSKLLDYLQLPKVITDFESAHLRKLNRLAIFFFAFHIPVLTAVAWANGTNAWLAAALSLGAISGPVIAFRFVQNPRSISIVHGVAAMFFGALLVHFGQGRLQIEMHFYFFAAVALLSIFGNPKVIIAAAATVALHHIALWFLLPKSVFNYDGSVSTVAVHVLFMVLESIAACYMARTFFDNVIGLVKTAADLDARNQDLRLVLDNVAEGFVTVDPAGRLPAERSLAFEKWFGPADTIFGAFAVRSPEFAVRLQIAWDALTEGFLPTELLLDQLPRRLTFDGIHCDVAYVPIGNAEPPIGYLVVVTDVTAEVARERSENERREVLLLFERALADRSGVDEYFEDASALVDAITHGAGTDRVTMKRWIHTLKGISSMFGLDSVATLCHRFEDYIAEEGHMPPAALLDKLTERWLGISQTLQRALGNQERAIELNAADHAALEVEVRPYSAELWRKIHALKLEPTRRRLEHFGEQANRIGARMEKSFDVVVEDNALRLEPKPWAPFWGAFAHAVRNAVDHGLETPAEREAAGKSPRGTLTLRTAVRGDSFVVEVFDDGRGIDWQRVTEKATAAGLPVASRDDLIAALFHDGLSTTRHVTELSGRGIGMGALLAAARGLDGDVSVESEVGKGTRVRMSFPLAMMAPEPAPASRRAQSKAA